ncbi:MAG: hypothetical protein U1G05_09955 [Kiritimatiellia bacterium]
MECADNVGQSDWTDVGPPVTATATITQVRDTGAASRPRSLYRVRLVAAGGE